MKFFKIAVIAGVIIIGLIFLFPYIQQSLIDKQKGEFIRNQTNIISEKSDNVIQCSYAKIRIPSAKYDNSDKKISATVENIGTATLSDIKFIIVLENGASSEYNSTLQKNLGPSEARIYSASIENGCNINSIIILADNCPTIAKERITRTDNIFTFTGC